MKFDHKKIVDYMQSLVTANSDTQSFYRMDILEIQNALRSGIQFPALAMESLEGDFTGTKSNNTNGNGLFAFSILKHPRLNNHEEENDFLNDCLLIGFEFLARMRKDSHNTNHFLRDNFLLEEVKWGKVGPLYSNRLYGYRFEIPLKQKLQLKVNIDKWSDIDDEC